MNKKYVLKIGATLEAIGAARATPPTTIGSLPSRNSMITSNGSDACGMRYEPACPSEA